MSATDLGLRYSCDMNFANQVHYQVAKSRRLAFFILRSFHLQATKLRLFKKQVRPILEYCTFTATYLSKAERVAIEYVQRKFTKALLFADRSMGYRVRCRKLQLDPLWLRRLKLNLIFLHNIIHNRTHLAAGLPTTTIKARYSLRSADTSLVYPRSTCSFHQYSFLTYYSSVWNKLPVAIRSATNIYMFRRLLSSHLSLENIRTLFSPHLTLDQLFEQGPLRI